MKLGRIVACKDVDFEYLRTFLEKYPIELTKQIIEFDELPTQIIGWDITKKLFPKHSILDKNINKNIFWTYSKDEKEDVFTKDIEDFVNQIIKRWLPKNFILFDPLLNEIRFDEFVSKNMDLTKRSYLYFHNDALYVNNDGSNIIFNVKAFKTLYSDYKMFLTNLINSFNCMCFSYKNISRYVYIDLLDCVYTLENARWVKFKTELNERYFQVIPGMDIEKYIAFFMSNTDRYTFTDDEKKSLRRACERDVITEWLSDRFINFDSEFKNFKFTVRGSNKLMKVNYSNKRTLTGRIVSSDKYNPQNLNKSTDDRTHIISRFKNGRIITLDYTSFEARIALYFCDDAAFISEYFDKDLHVETAKIIYGPRNSYSEEERDFAKIINHSVLYGASRATVLEKLKFLNNCENVFYEIREFLAPLLKKSDKIREQYLSKEYIVNDWGTIIYPEKEHAVFNNYIQSTATEILVDKLYEIKEVLKDYESDLLFQVHDSMIFDIHPEEKDVIYKLVDKLTDYKGMKYPMSYSFGSNYKNLSKEIQLSL